MVYNLFSESVELERKVEPVPGMTWVFAKVPSPGRITEDTYLIGGDSKGESCFQVKPHFHPRTTEHFFVVEGEVHFELDGKKYIAEQSEKPFVIPKGVVHGVTFPKGKPTKFLLRAGSDSEVVAGRDFLMEFLSLIAEKQLGLLKKYTCWFKSGNYVPLIGWVFPKTVGRILVFFLGGVLGTFLGLGKANLKED